MPGELERHGRIVRLGNGLPIEVNTRDLVGGFIARHGWWEPETVAFMQRWLRPGMTVIDAGAHVGQYALLASGCVGPEGRVHAFEPHPRLHAILCRNLARVGCTNVAAQPLALGRRCEERPFFLARTDNLGASSLRPDPLVPDSSAVRVQVTSLDAYLAAHAVPHVDLLKINVEGAERDVLAGAAATLAANPDIVLVVEFLRENAERWGHTIEALETDLRAYGFRLFALSGLGLAPYTPVGRLAVNVVAARHVTRVLPGLPEALAAQLLMRLCDATGARGPRLATPQASGEVRYVISRRTAGIGDLLVNLLAAWRFAAYTGRTLAAIACPASDSADAASCSWHGQRPRRGGVPRSHAGRAVRQSLPQDAPELPVAARLRHPRRRAVSMLLLAAATRWYADPPYSFSPSTRA